MPTKEQNIDLNSGHNPPKALHLITMGYYLFKELKMSWFSLTVITVSAKAIYSTTLIRHTIPNLQPSITAGGF